MADTVFTETVINPALPTHTSTHTAIAANAQRRAVSAVVNRVHSLRRKIRNAARARASKAATCMGISALGRIDDSTRIPSVNIDLTDYAVFCHFNAYFGRRGTDQYNGCTNQREYAALKKRCAIWYEQSQNHGIASYRSVNSTPSTTLGDE